MKYSLILILIATTACTSSSSFSVSCPTFYETVTTYDKSNMKTMRDFKCADCNLMHSVHDGVKASNAIKYNKASASRDVKAVILTIIPFLLFL